MMFRWIKHFFCKHEWEICRKIEPFASLRGEQLYRVCRKCGKIEPHIYREFDGGWYK